MYNRNTQGGVRSLGKKKERKKTEKENATIPQLFQVHLLWYGWKCYVLIITIIRIKITIVIIVITMITFLYLRGN